MSSPSPPPGLRAARGLVAVVLCAPALAAAKQSSSAATDTSTPPQPWVVKITPVYDGLLQSVEIRYRHRPKPFVLRPGEIDETLIRPTIRLDAAGREAWLGLDVDLAWEGRCSLAGQWLVLDADRSGPGLSTANVRYNLRTRRLIVTSGSSQVLIDLKDGSISGPASMLGGAEQLRDYFLSHGGEPMRLRVSDRPGSSGVVWIFSDLASVAVGPDDQAWFTASATSTGDAPGDRWPEMPRTVADRTRSADLPLVAPPSVEPSPRRPSIVTPAEFGSQAFRCVAATVASSARPTPLSSWPGKDLPPRPPADLLPWEAARLGTLLDGLAEEWRGYGDWSRRVAETVLKMQGPADLARGPIGGRPIGAATVRERIDRSAIRLRSSLPDGRGSEQTTPHGHASSGYARALNLSRTTADPAQVEGCAREMARASGFPDGQIAFRPEAPEAGRSRSLTDLQERLDRLALAIASAHADARKKVQEARDLAHRAADLPDAERRCRRLAIGTTLNDQVLCLLMDLAAEDGPLPDRTALMALVAQRLLGQARQDVLARLWGQTDLLMMPRVSGEIDQPWGRMPNAIGETPIAGLDLDAAADRALTAIASAVYEETLPARHFLRHLSRRFPDRLGIAPTDVARLVEELDAGAVIAPTGLDRLVTMCSTPRLERAATMREATAKVLAIGRLIERVETLIDRAVARRSARLGGGRQAEVDYQAARDRQRAEVFGLLRWVCTTYADQIFGRTDLTRRQRKDLILAAAAWWARQWQMDLCWMTIEFDIDVRREGRRYAWRVHGIRVDLLDEPDPEAVVEERLAQTPPVRAFPLGSMRLASGQVIKPRRLADVTAVEPHAPATPPSPILAEATEGPSGANDPTPHKDTPRMILPGAPEAILAEAIETDDPSPPAPATAPSPVADPPRQSIDVMIGAGRPGEVRRIDALAGQIVQLRGTARFATPPGQAGYLFVDLHADDPAASRLQFTTSPKPDDHVATVDLPSGRWLRRILRWPTPTTASASFDVEFRVPIPKYRTQTLTLVLSLATGRTGRPDVLAERTFIFSLHRDTPPPRRGLADARRPPR